MRRQLLEDGVLGTQPDLGRIHRAATSQRTRDALAAERARGERLGAAPALPMQITRRIIAERGNGRTFQAIGEGLMADGVPTARGQTRWYAATIKAVVTSDNAAAWRSAWDPFLDSPKGANRGEPATGVLDSAQTPTWRPGRAQVPVDRHRRHPQAVVMLQMPGNGRWPMVKPLSAWSYGALT